MGDITFTCVHCRKSLVIDDKGAGFEVECPQCRNTLTVPDEVPPDEYQQNQSDYQIDKLLYLNDWDVYTTLLDSKKVEHLSEIFCFRAWLYCFAFRRVVADRDELVDPMLNQLFGLLKTLGAGVFLFKCNVEYAEIPRLEHDPEESGQLIAKLFERFEEYDDALVKATTDKPYEIKDVLSYVYRRMLKKLDIDPIRKTFSERPLLNQLISDVFIPASTIAKQFA